VENHVEAVFPGINWLARRLGKNPEKHRKNPTRGIP